MADLVLFYGTLMTGFDRRRRVGIDAKLRYQGRGWISAALFDLGLYPAAGPARRRARVGRGVRATEPSTGLAALDEVEGYRPAETDASLYVRAQVPVHLPDGTTATAWVAPSNAPLGRAPQITLG